MPRPYRMLARRLRRQVAGWLCLVPLKLEFCFEHGISSVQCANLTPSAWLCCIRKCLRVFVDSLPPCCDPQPTIHAPSNPQSPLNSSQYKLLNLRMPSSRPSPWMVSSTAKRVEFSEPKFTTLLLRFYHDPDLFKVLTPLAQNTAVETVHIVSCSLNDEASRALRNSLAENESVDTIVVEKCIVKPKRLKRILTGLAANTDSQISEITFTSCELQDRAVQFVSEVIISPPPDDKCLLKSLTLLDLSVNKIADSGAVALSYLLRPSAGSLLTVLNLRDNRIGDRGAQVRATRKRLTCVSPCSCCTCVRSAA